MKKILSMLLSLALVSASFVTAFADAKPYASVTVNPLDAAKYEEVMMEAVPAGSNAYEVVIDFNNLPDLTWGRSGAGIRLGSFSVKLFTDITKITKTQGMNVDQAAEAWGADTYGVLKVANDNIVLNAEDKSISIVKAVSAAADGFPYATGEATADVDGTLANAVVLYVAATEEPVFTSVLAQVAINNNSATNNTVTKVTEFFAGVEGNVNSDNSYNVGVETSKTADSSFSATEVVFDFVAADGAAAEYAVALPTTIESGSNVVVALNVTNVPAGVSFQYTGATFN